jgi:ABC-2 type transport system ATP-binding protein
MSTPILQCEHLSKRFGDVLAVDDLSLEVNQGEIFGFLGPNGAGKTTTISILCGLLQPNTGSVRLFGRSAERSDPTIRARLGFCPQATVLWEKLTCLEQLVFTGQMYDLTSAQAQRRGEMLLEALALEEKRNKLAGTLSGGMKRRLNLALALVHDPEIVVLDEPEAGLDPQSRAMVREYIRALAPRKTVILTTHNMDEADRLAQRVAIIDRGRLLVLDTPEALKQKVGEGDVLEIEIMGEAHEPALQSAARLGLHASTSNHNLVLRGRGLVEKLPGLINTLHAAGITTGEVKLRTNTLEDVFLQLTGRRLRE